MRVVCSSFRDIVIPFEQYPATTYKQSLYLALSISAIEVDVKYSLSSLVYVSG